MKQETSQKLCIVALVFSLFPAISYVLPVFKISLAGGAQAAMAAANILCSLAGFALSIICVKSKETRNAVNIIFHYYMCLMVAFNRRIWRTGIILDFCKDSLNNLSNNKPMV